MNKIKATKFKNILVLFDLLITVHQKDTQYLKQLYLQNAEDFENCVEFLLSLELIKLNSGYIEMTPHFNKFLLKRPKEEETKVFIIKKLLNKKNLNVWRYLERFKIINDKYVFEPSVAANLEYSNIRNLLIELGFVSYNLGSNIYVITEDYITYFLSVMREHVLSPAKLLKILKEQNKIGNYAEIEIIKYEKSRLSSHQDLLSKIEHKSLQDTTAGYDIKSFTLGKNSVVSERFIEVKAISLIEKKFFLTRNELEISKKEGLKYFLYLLPVIGKYKFDTTNLIIVQDPSNTIFNSDNWNINIEEYSIVKKEHNK